MVTADDALCFGDHVALYCGDAMGYVYAMLSSSAHAHLAVNNNESRDQTQCGDIQMVSFKLCAPNRYKLQKEFKKLARLYADSEDKNQRTQLELARLAAESEAKDNAIEQARQKGKKVLYGQVIQLQHEFTDKFVHISTQSTSVTESSNMKVLLCADNSGSAKFKLTPRFKVKSFGDLVQAEDQVVLESLKSPGQYLHVSRAKYRQHLPVYRDSFELNLSVVYSGFILIRRHSDSASQSGGIRAGQPLRLFHTELEAYLVCEGSFDESPVEDVHLRIRAIDQSKPKTLLKPSSAICYWQLELVENSVSGGIVCWKQPVRMRHMCTRKFLCLNTRNQLELTDDRTDDRTVFRLHQVLQEDGSVSDASYCRIQHAATKTWLNASKEKYIRKGILNDSEAANSMSGLIWSQAPLRKIKMSFSSQFDDAFTIYAVEKDLIEIFNYVAGFVPLIQHFIIDDTVTQGNQLDAYTSKQLLVALSELRDFIVNNNVPSKRRSKLLRNLRVVDHLFQVLRIPLQGSSKGVLPKIVEECYDIIYQYLYGDSRKNELYCARYLDFLHQSRLQSDINLNATRTLMVIMWDNRKIIDRIPRSYVEEYINLLQKNRCYEYLELLSVLCVCMGMSMPGNQNFITQKWLVEGGTSSAVFFTELGQKIGKEKDKVFVSMDNRRTWVRLSDLAQEYVSIVGPKDLENEMTSRQIRHGESKRAKNLIGRNDSGHESTWLTVRNFKFLKYQLDLFGKLCRGRNSKSIAVITRQLGYLTWEEAFACLKDDTLPCQLRAKYCELITNMFVDIDNNISVLDRTDLVFDYNEISKDMDVKKFQISGPTANTNEYFPLLSNWLSNFLDQNKVMVDSNDTLNILLAEVLRMLQYLVKFGSYSSTNDIRRLLAPLLGLLDGRNDLPTHMENLHMESGRKLEEEHLLDFKLNKRFECIRQDTVAAKYEAMRVLDLFFNFQCNLRLDQFIAEFKRIRAYEAHEVLKPLLREDYAHDDFVNSVACKEMASIFSKCSYFTDLSMEWEPAVEVANSANIFHRMSKRNSQFTDRCSKYSADIISILMDISRYRNSRMVQMSMWLLNRYFSGHSLLFRRAALSQLLITEKSVSVRGMIDRESHVMKRMIESKMTDVDVETMVQILRNFCNVCYLEDDPEERHEINQMILYNSGILNDLFDLVSQNIEIAERAEYSGLRMVFAKCFELLALMARDNPLVQNHMFDRLDGLLNCVGAEKQLAMALVEVFTGNKGTCMKVLPQQIGRLISLVAQHGEKVPEFLYVLNALVKIEQLNLPVKRNQQSIMTCLMQHRSQIAQCLDQSMKLQLSLLRSNDRSPQLEFMIGLVDLLATCSEGANQSIESKNRSIYSVSDVLTVLNDSVITGRNKLPYARFLLWVYLNTASAKVDRGLASLPHETGVWLLFKSIGNEMKQMAGLAHETPEIISRALKISDLTRHVSEADKKNPNVQNVHHTLRFIIEGILPIITSFFKTVYLKDLDNYPTELEEIDTLTRSFLEFSGAILPLVTQNRQFKNIISCANSLISVCNLPAELVEPFKATFLSGMWQCSNTLNPSRQRYIEYYASEMALNKQFNLFARNYCMAYGGRNTIRAQTGYPSDEEYTNLGSDDELPLGQEFQEHLACFVDTSFDYSDPRRFIMTGKLVEQLCISNQMELRNEKERINQELLDIKCLQLLRGVVHNEIVKLADNIDSEEYRRGCSRVSQVQIAVNSHGAMLKVLPNLVKPSDDIVREVLNFLAAMLYNGNTDVQESMYQYFNHTREENFFFTIHHRISMSLHALKENRALIYQQQDKIDEKMAELRSQLALLNKDPTALDSMQHTEQGAKLIGLLLQKDSDASRLRRNHRDRLNASNAQTTLLLSSQKLKLNRADLEGLATQLVMADENLQMNDDCHIELVLRVLAYICDGQNSHLQDYLREQPDNMKSFNLVAKTVEYLSLVYTSVHRWNISLVIQLVETLVEFVLGNLKNQIVCYDNKLCDCLNYLLRSQQLYSICELKEEIQLKLAIANLIMALVEENVRWDHSCHRAVHDDETNCSTPNSVVVKDTIGPEIICQILADLYERQLNASLGPDVREDLLRVGFRYYHILMRFQDLEPDRKIPIGDFLNFRQSVADMKDSICEFYRFNTMSIELLKDDNLQKIYFRVRDRKVLRQEVKDRFNYEVDRSSPANKLRDFCEWLKEIIEDIQWQKRVLCHPVGAFFVRGWKAFNMACIVLSLLICCIVIASWTAAKDASDPTPVRSTMSRVTVLILGLLHNLMSIFVLISFFLCNKPYVPTLAKVKAYWCRTLGIEAKASENENVLDDVEGHLKTSVFSFGTFYYVIFVVFSLLGTPLHGYFFSFHLLHIANHNQLLRRVFQAITRNGLSLVWVMMYSIAIFYIYALICFAYYRDIFVNAKGSFCSNMLECTVTVIRRGLITGMYDESEFFDVPNNRTFNYHMVKSVFDISFFIIITTIGLNIVFGIIVDTFSELRDSKWQVDKDMSTVCFICSRNSYDFEHYGKGFSKHVTEEHNLWAYLFFFLHLNETKFNDYTAIELYVFRLYEKDRLDYFPLNRSLTLQAAEDGQDETKLDSLMAQVAFLVRRKKEEDALKERRRQESAQKLWEEQQKIKEIKADEQLMMYVTLPAIEVAISTSSSEDEY